MDRETFNRIKEQAMKEVIEKFYPNAEPTQKLAIQHFLEQFLNTFMKAERNIFLENQSDNKANGFYERTLTTGSFKLNLQVPRDRKSTFRPHILPEPYKRVDQSYTDLIMSLIINGYSESQLRSSLRQLGLPYSEEELNKIKAQLLEKLSDFKQKELPENALALFIDAYHTEVKHSGKVKKSCVYVVLGLDLDGHKDVYGFYTFFGNENRTDWLQVFNDLIERGLKRVALIVSDDFPGIDKAINALFPKSDHQLCYVHLKKNVQRNMGKEDAKIFNKELDRIRQSNTFDEGRELFEVLCERFKEKYSSYIRTIREKVENYLCFLKYPEEIRRHIYTTNGVESINRLLEKIRERLGGYFQSVEILEINMYLQIESLRDGRWRNGIPAIKSKKYEIIQIFNLKFYHDLQTQNY